MTDENKTPETKTSCSEATSDLETSPNLSNSLLSQSYDEHSFIYNTTGVFRSKIFNDPIHGSIELPGALIKIIDTPQFQRLRRLKQLGASYFVFTGAAHQRFEHSIGTCYLAGELLTSIRQRQPELKITDKDVLCVQIAALCHDIGHGPFSHMFEEIVDEIRPEKKWEHENASIQMIDHIFEENKLLEQFKRFKIDKNDLTFIKEIIVGPPKSTQQNQDWLYEGRPKEKSFLYEIVSNKLTGIDVDKFDYFARDSYHLGTRNSFDHVRFIKFYRVVLCEDGLRHLCLRDKEVKACYEIYRIRDDLHRRAYQHPIVRGIDLMIKEALMSANDYLLFSNRKGEKVTLADTVDDMFTFGQIDDHILTLIKYSSDPRMEKAKKIIDKIERRDLCRFLGSTNFKYASTLPKIRNKDVRRGIWEKLQTIEDGKHLKEDDIDVHVVVLICGDRGEDPIRNMWFYTKDQPDRATRIERSQVSTFLPENFREYDIRVYSKNRDRNICSIVRSAFKSFCEEKNYPMPKGFGLWLNDDEKPE